MGLPLRSPVAKLSCEAATEENAKRRSFMPRTQVTGKANLPGTDKPELTVRFRCLLRRMTLDHQSDGGECALHWRHRS